jgi:hypothetical protein
MTETKAHTKIVGYFLDQETDRYHVQVYIATGGCTLSHEWAFVRPSVPVTHPYVFSRKDATEYIRTHVTQSGQPSNYGLFRLAPMP